MFSVSFFYFFHSKIWAHFHFGTFEPYKQHKSWKISYPKKVKFQGWLKLAQFLITEFLGLPTLESKISGISPSILEIFVPILLQISWIFQNTPYIFNWDGFEGSCWQKTKKLKIRKFASLSHPWNLTFFENDIFELFCCLYGSKVPKWKCAHILLRKKPKN